MCAALCTWHNTMQLYTNQSGRPLTGHVQSGGPLTEDVQSGGPLTGYVQSGRPLTGHARAYIASLHSFFIDKYKTDRHQVRAGENGRAPLHVREASKAGCSKAENTWFAPSAITHQAFANVRSQRLRENQAHWLSVRCMHHRCEKVLRHWVFDAGDVRAKVE